MYSSFDRRQVLAGSLGLFVGSRLPNAPIRRESDDPTLVLLQLSGGNDGLSTLVPFADDAYHRARPKLSLKPDELLPLDDQVAFHGELKGLRRRYDDGSLAVVRGVGYPSPNRSHFKSFEIWHTADLRGRNSGPGWVGRLCDAAFGSAYDPYRVVHVGASLPYSLQSKSHPAISFVVPEGYRWVRHADDIGAVTREASATKRKRANPSLDFLRGVMNDARESSARVRAAAMRYRPRVEYPSGALADSLRAIAALIEAEVGCRILSVDFGGFDTHNDQLRRHRQQMGRLDQALDAFLDDLKHSNAGRRTVVLVFSEFGRRVQENGSGGTDHGKAGLAMVASAGDLVRGGMYGALPSLEDLDAGDLRYTTDFRSIYAEFSERLFAVSPQTILGDRFETLGFLG